MTRRQPQDTSDHHVFRAFYAPADAPVATEKSKRLIHERCSIVFDEDRRQYLWRVPWDNATDIVGESQGAADTFAEARFMVLRHSTARLLARSFKHVPDMIPDLVQEAHIALFRWFAENSEHHEQFNLNYLNNRAMGYALSWYKQQKLRAADSLEGLAEGMGGGDDGDDAALDRLIEASCAPMDDVDAYVALRDTALRFTPDDRLLMLAPVMGYEQREVGERIGVRDPAVLSRRTARIRTSAVMREYAGDGMVERYMGRRAQRKGKARVR